MELGEAHIFVIVLLNGGTKLAVLHEVATAQIEKSLVNYLEKSEESIQGEHNS